MLRCHWSALRITSRASTSTLPAHAPLLTRPASQWRRAGHSKKPKTGKRRPSLLAASEKENRNEIRELRGKLSVSNKQKEAEEASEKMGEFDEETLELVYKAVNTADPPTPEEVRLESRRKQRMLGGSSRGAHLLDTWNGRRIAQRLTALGKRMNDLHPAARLATEGGAEADGYERVSQLLTQLGVPKEEAISVDEGTASVEETDTTERSIGASIVRDGVVREQLLNKLQELASLISLRSSQRGGEQSSLPMGIATKQEWEALAVAFAYAGEEGNVEKTLEAMEQTGQASALKDVVNAVMDVYAQSGNVDKSQLALTWITAKGVVADDYTHHCLVKSFVNSSRLHDAVDLLSQLATKQPASMQSYTLVLEHLLQQTSSPTLQSKAWSLFNQMRLTAHPIPDAPLYAQMIKACALGVPQPNSQLWQPKSPLLAGNQAKRATSLPDSERALDLFRELTMRYNIRPTAEVYSAVILACARRKDMYEKGLELFRSMVEVEKNQLQSDETGGTSSFAPSREVYNALLQGCAKNGDLLRARWILAEMLRSAALRWQELVDKQERGEQVLEWEMHDVEARRPDENTLSLVFYSYASCKTIPKASAPIVAPDADAEGTTPATSGVAEGQDGQEVQTEERHQAEDETTLTYRLPRTRKAVLREASSLMERIKRDVETKTGLLSSIKPNARLLNGFLAVVSGHCSERERVDRISSVLFGGGDGEAGAEQRSLFDQLAVQVNGFTCEIALDGCSKNSRREDAVGLAERVWSVWIEMGGSGHRHVHDGREAARLGLDALTISRAWSAMIRTLAKAGQLDKAMKLLRLFARLYPPPTAKATTLPTATHVPLSGTSLLSPVQGEEIAHLQQTASRPPLLSFPQLAILHHRLVESENREQDVAFLSWLIKASDASTRPRIPDGLKGTSLLGRQAAVQRLVQQRLSGLLNASPKHTFRRLFE